MKNRNFVMQAAVASALLAASAFANAGIVAPAPAARNVALEDFGSAVTLATLVDSPPLTYTFATPGGIVVNPGGSIVVVFTPVGAPTFSNTNPLASGNITLPAAVGGSLSAAATYSGSSLVVTLTNSTSAVSNAVIGVGAVLTAGATGANNTTAIPAFANATQLAAGTPIQVTGYAALTVGGVILEATSPAATVVTSAHALNVAFVPSSSFGTVETLKIDVTEVPPLTHLVDNGGTTNTANNGTLLDVGSVTWVNNVTPQNQLTYNGSGAEVPVNLANATAFTALETVTLGLASGNFSIGTAFAINDAANCTGTSLGSSQLPLSTNVTAATPSVVLTTGARPTASTTYYVCASFVATLADPILQFQATGSGTVPGVTPNYASFNTSAPTNLYNLTVNGTIVNVMTYIPGSENGGYTTFIRVINNGEVPAPITGAFIDPVTGNVGTSGVFINPLAAGGAKTLTAAQIEALLAPVTPPAAGTRPRLQITAPTNSMQVQSWILTNANGVFSNVSASETNAVAGTR